ncbi:H3 lysine-36 specific,Histone-lysine N-methyltransferase [Trichinella spiralis]|uniref:H3 lysine-36 specific,Histone-lysine N-methyltransferase n=1 Tax=Trichinella spiralis TaxID=6334 RepID=A0ABR3KHE9_TRISP
MTTDSLPDTRAIFPDNILSYASETEHATTYSDFVAVIDPSVATTAIETPTHYVNFYSSAIASGSVCMLNGHSDVLMDDADDPAPSTRIALSDLLQEEEISQNLNDLFTFLFPSSPARKNVMYQYNTSEFDSDLDKCYENFVKKSSDLKATAAEDWKKKKVKEFMVTLLKEELENLNSRSKLANLASTSSLAPVETDSADSGTNDADGSAIDLDIVKNFKRNMKCNNLDDVATDYAD